tara:strand:- start:620 stop:781 length:162 start_codon:yes stop_codon:yes gene_type:complete
MLLVRLAWNVLVMAIAVPTPMAPNALLAAAVAKAIQVATLLVPVRMGEALVKM